MTLKKGRIFVPPLVTKCKYRIPDFICFRHSVYAWFIYKKKLAMSVSFVVTEFYTGYQTGRYPVHPVTIFKILSENRIVLWPDTGHENYRMSGLSRAKINGNNCQPPNYLGCSSQMECKHTVKAVWNEFSVAGLSGQPIIRFRSGRILPRFHSVD